MTKDLTLLHHLYLFLLLHYLISKSMLLKLKIVDYQFLLIVLKFNLDICLSCRQDMHNECDPGICSCTHRAMVKDRGSERTEMDTSLESNRVDGSEQSWRVSVRDSRSKSSNRRLKDQQSTGRKRAAKLYPLRREANCEWQYLRFAGGGAHPII